MPSDYELGRLSPVPTYNPKNSGVLLRTRVFIISHDAFVLWGNLVLERNRVWNIGARPPLSTCQGPHFSRCFSHGEAEDVAGVEGSDLSRKGRPGPIPTRTC